MMVLMRSTERSMVTSMGKTLSWATRCRHTSNR
uniref:Protein MEI2-like 2 n=1 Tax=Rhizophora mucronata TaxID=61149 RepID=A0A2P2QMY4_RHIMU